MKNFSKKLLFAASIITSVSLFAAEDQEEKDYDQGHGVPSHQMMGAYNAPARYDVNGSLDLFLTVSFLYWQAKQQSLDLGYTSFNDPTTTRGPLHEMDFDFKPGFKVGLGINMSYDNWDLFLEYLRLHGNHRRSVTQSDDAVLSTFWRGAAEAADTIHGHWKCGIDLLDLIMSRPYYLGTKLTFMPFAGLRSGWLDQKFNVTNDQAGTVAITSTESDSWLIGPRFGINGSWHLGEGFRIFTNIAASLFYQHFKMNLKYYAADSTVLQYNNRDKDTQLTPNVELAVGLAWGMYLANNDWHIDLLAGYEFHHFWNQNKMRTLYDAIINNVITTPADLMLQGLTITARLDF